MNIRASLANLALSLGTVLALGAPSLASAAVVNGSDFTQGAQTQTIGGLAWAISPVGKTFQKKTLGGYTGVGISGGRTPDEIDVDEFLTGTSVSGTFGIGSFRLGVLFDGPEFGDWNEIAEVTARRQNGSTIVHTLRADTATSTIWTGSGTVTNLSPAQSGSGAVWNIGNNPFGNFTDFVSISFTAKLSTFCDQPSCSNQSDFTLVQLTTTPGGTGTGTSQSVPEPASLALVGLGLLGMAAVRRRRG